MTDAYRVTGSTAEVEAAILGSLATITNHWDALLVPNTSHAAPGQPRATTSSRGVPAHDPDTDPLGVLVKDDHLDTDEDIDRATRAVSLRRFTVDVLNGWSRVVMEDRPVTKALPDGTDAMSMCGFLEVHARWMSGHEAATDCADELGALARDITRMVVPKRKDYVYLGDCPFVVEDWFCAGRVRSRIGGDKEASCSDCGQTAVIEWWEDVLGISPVEGIVGAVRMAEILHDRLHITVNERTVRNWARWGRITAFVPFGPQPQTPRWWFDARATLDEVARMDRECPSCGRGYQGVGDVCARCYTAMQDARPTWAKRRKHAPAPVQRHPRRILSDPHDTDRPDRCHWSDLPLTQCACGRPHRVSA